MLSLDDFDLTKKCETPFEFQVVDQLGKNTGFFITVLGDHAPAVKSKIYSALNARRVQDAMNAKLGDKAPVRTVEQDIDDGYDLTACRVVSWRGVKEECTPENVIRYCEKNHLINAQILKASGELANFP